MIIFVLIILLIGSVAIWFGVKFYEKERKKQIEIYIERFEPLNQQVLYFAKRNDLNIERFELFTPKGKNDFSKNLSSPRVDFQPRPRIIYWISLSTLLLQPDFSSTFIYYYSDSDDYRAPIRFAWIASGLTAMGPVKVFFLPIYFSNHKTGKVRGVIFCHFPVEPTRHWFSLESEGAFESKFDHDLESRYFNKRFRLNGSERKMLTEIFDPKLICLFNDFQYNSLIFKQNKYGFFSYHRLAFNETEVEKFFKLSVECHNNFVKAFKSHPEPK
ncbi:hypothetical protein C4546_04170 [Candidatus Parcubacteria bacterium]|jgi:hypothetical protein|nr:MAG: hypothetical protein C4546_04170 [Candidatus Parcubacteria bacterium]